MSDNLMLVIVLVLLSGLVFSTWIFQGGGPVAAFSSDTGLPDGEFRVAKVIDGDTVIVEGGREVRLEGIDTDEREHPCYKPAKRKLEELVLGKEVRLESTGRSKGKYDRFLRYLFMNGTNINVEMVREGMAVARPSEDKYREKIVKAEKEAMEEEKGCKWQVSDWTGNKDATVDSAVNREKGTIDACNADNFLGRDVELRGRVVDSYSSESAVYLNFGREYPNQCFNAVIWSESFHRFPENPAERYLGRKVAVEGEVERYNGTYEMVLEDQS
ncbi:MAG: thermonuclease family protein, partial [Candidatus Nanohaloarchaea archaeon]|nr:thermonuclease family protein [Candidatus Nanohaloarchaea archaeon]